MNILLQLLLISILAFISGALLAWPVYEVLHLFLDVRFHKIVSNTITLCAFVFVYLLLSYHNALDRETTGFETRTTGIHPALLRGFAAGILIMTVLEVLLYGLGIHKMEPELQPGAGFFLLLTGKAVISGIMVGLVEESLYRGALLGILLRKTGILTAILVSSTVYSAVHFIGFPAVGENTDVHILTGLALLPDAFVRFSDPGILDAFLALTLFGALLALVRIRNGNIIQCIGLHAGVVIAIRFIKDLTDYAHGNRYAYLVSTYDHLLGYLALFWLVMLTAGYFWIHKQKICNKST